MQKNITLHTVADYAALSTLAAKIFVQTVANHPAAAYGFATGGTAEGLYQELVKMSQTREINLSQITAFNLDEYVPIAPDSPQSYAYYMATKLFDAAGVPAANRNIPRGDAPCPVTEAAAYEEKITASGGIKLQILGIGNNGHIAFNEPTDTFAGKTSHVELAQATIDANARYFSNKDEVPKHAISMGMQTIMMSEQIMMLASGEGKAEILHKALTGPITPQVPASVLQLHRNVIVIADQAAAKYFDKQ